MKCQARVALGVAGGYLLGRTKKLKLALTVAGFVAGRRGGVGNLLAQGGELLKQSPELARLADQVRGRLIDAGKGAAMAVATRQVESLTDRVSKRVESLGTSLGEAGGQAGRAGQEVGERLGGRREPAEQEEAPEEAAPEEAAAQAGKDTGDEEPEERAEAAAEETAEAPERREPDRGAEDREHREGPREEDRGGRPARATSPRRVPRQRTESPDVSERRVTSPDRSRVGSPGGAPRKIPGSAGRSATPRRSERPTRPGRSSDDD